MPLTPTGSDVAWQYLQRRPKSVLTLSRVVVNQHLEVWGLDVSVMSHHFPCWFGNDAASSSEETSFTWAMKTSGVAKARCSRKSHVALNVPGRNTTSLAMVVSDLGLALPGVSPNKLGSRGDSEARKKTPKCLQGPAIRASKCILSATA